MYESIARYNVRTTRLKRLIHKYYCINIRCNTSNTRSPNICLHMNNSTTHKVLDFTESISVYFKTYQQVEAIWSNINDYQGCNGHLPYVSLPNLNPHRPSPIEFVYEPGETWDRLRLHEADLRNKNYEKPRFSGEIQILTLIRYQQKIATLVRIMLIDLIHSQ